MPTEKGAPPRSRDVSSLHHAFRTTTSDHLADGQRHKQGRRSLLRRS